MSECVLMVAGQSNGTQMCSVPVAGCNPVAGSYVWQPNSVWRAMTSSDGAGMIDLAAGVLASGFSSVYVYNCTYGGSSVVPQAAFPSYNCWHNPNPGGPRYDCEVQVSAGGKSPQAVIWVQGEQEVVYSGINPAFDIAAHYKADLDSLRNHLNGLWGQCPWLVTPVGRVSTFSTQAVLQAQIDYATSAPGVFLGPSRSDLEVLDQGGMFVHLTGPACRIFAGRILPLLLEVLVMTDPQDKAAIAALLVAVAALQAAQATRDAELAANLAQIQTAINNLCAGLGALESLSPSAVNWPIEWAC